MALFGRIKRLFKGFMSLFISGLEEGHPEALLEAAKEDFRDKMVRYNQSLARIAGIAERLKIQIKSKTGKAQELDRRILVNYKAGNMELAGSLARELQELKPDLEHDSEELRSTEEAYEMNVKNAKIAQKEFEEKIRRLEQQLSQVKIKEAQSEAAGALSGVSFKVGDMGDTLKGVEEILNKRYEKASGKARVAYDMLDEDGIKEKESERKALEQQALAEFLAKQGIQLAPETPAPGTVPVKKEIGPQPEKESEKGNP